MPREEYLEWTGAGSHEAAGALSADGSLFLNVGAKPTDPWTAIDVAQAVARRSAAAEHHPLGEVDRDREGAGRNARRPARTIWRSATTSRSTAGGSSTTATSSCSTSRRTAHAARSPGRRRASTRIESNVARWRTAASGVRCRGNTWFIPYETIQSREKDRPHPATFPPKLPEMCLRLHGLDRLNARGRPVPGPRIDGGRLRATRVSFVGIEMDEDYLRRSGRTNARRARDAALPGIQAESSQVGFDDESWHVC